MTENLGTLDDWALWLAAVVAGLGAAGWILRRLWRGYRLLRRWAADLERRWDAIEDLVAHELVPNSGSSMKDQLGRVEQATATLRGLVLINAGMLEQHIKESRSYIAEAQEILGGQGIILPDYNPPREVPPDA